MKRLAFAAMEEATNGRVEAALVSDYVLDLRRNAFRLTLSVGVFLTPADNCTSWQVLTFGVVNLFPAWFPCHIFWYEFLPIPIVPRHKE